MQTGHGSLGTLAQPFCHGFQVSAWNRGCRLRISSLSFKGWQVLLPWKFWFVLLVRLRFPTVYNISCYDTLPEPSLLMLGYGSVGRTRGL